MSTPHAAAVRENPVRVARPVVPPVGLVATVLALAAGSFVAVASLTLRIARTDELTFFFLAWNLFLAWLPFLLTLLLLGLHHARAHGLVLLAVGVPWLLLLPNAPYLMTDLVHVRPREGVPVWFDAGLVMAYAALGLLLGIASLMLVHRLVAARLGAVAGWAFAAVVLPLTVAGVWLGRVHRFNSWDVLTALENLVHVVLIRAHDPFGNRDLLVAGVLGTAALAGVYLGAWALVSAYAAATRRTTPCVR
ncbi:hypothetical protein GCM10027418_29430 [Mariniluteicoccus endophyticus]